MPDAHVDGLYALSRAQRRPERDAAVAQRREGAALPRRGLVLADEHRLRAADRWQIERHATSVGQRSMRTEPTRTATLLAECGAEERVELDTVHATRADRRARTRRPARVGELRARWD